jgi:hypothetical protein
MLAKIFLMMPLEAKYLIVAIGFMTLLLHWRYTPVIANKAPALLTTLGILGTFLGIAIGLLDFNTKDLQQSVPALIDGIKTAFWVSTAGVLGAITIKVREIVANIGSKKIKNAYQGATVNDLADLLLNIKNALVGEDDSTLLGQIKLSRQDSHDKITALKNSLDIFCEKSADNNSQVLMNALQEVIKDFNVKINEQFGENFKHLNQAIGKTLEWQEQYRLQIIETIEQQTKTSNNMAISTEAMNVATEKYVEFMKSSEIFNMTAEKLSETLHILSDSIATMEAQRHQIQESISALAILINNASVGLPKIEENILLITNQLSKSVQVTGEKFNTVLLESINEFKALMLNTIQTTNQEVSANITNIIENTKEQVVVLDTALSAQLDKALVSFGNQLAALSRKFVDDYEPLTLRLRQVLELARVDA